MMGANETDRAAAKRRAEGRDRPTPSGVATTDPQTPTNKGAEIAIAVDWLSVTVREIAVGTVLPIIARVVPTTWTIAPGRSGYRQGLKGVGGSQVLWSPDRSDMHIDLPGRWCASASQNDLQALLGAFTALGGRWSRCDLAGTDRQRVAEPEDVAAAIERGEHVTHARQFKLLRGLAGCKGATVYIGSNASRQQLLVYDKAAESGGKIQGVRWELRSRAEAAASLVAVLIARADWGAVWARRVVGFVDFRERKPGRDPKRCRRTAWFARLVGSVRRASAYAPDPDPQDGLNLEWLQRQVAPSLARLVQAHGGDLEPVHALVAHGGRRRAAATRPD